MFKRPTIGMRTIKTMLTTGVCALIYYWIGRNPAFACIGVIFGMGRDMAMTLRNGFNRLGGTIIGGLLGMLFRWLHIQLVPDDHFSLWLVLLTCAATFLLIILCQIFRPEGVHPGCIIMIVVMYNDHFEPYYTYALNNILDTVIGVSFAMGVSWLFPKGWINVWPERLAKWRAKKSVVAE